MPTRVEPPQRPESFPRDPHSHMHDSHSANRNAQHRDALRLALGSILAPKRPTVSRSSSGSATPNHHSPSYASTPPPPPPPPNPSPAGRTPDLHSYPHSHLHHPSPLGNPDAHSDDDLASHYGSSNASSEALPLVHASEGDTEHALPPSERAIHSPIPIPSDTVPVTIVMTRTASGTIVPKAKFIETLQSKSAWDALIHGSFS